MQLWAVLANHMRAERRRNIVQYFNFLFHEFRYAFSTIKFTNIELIILKLSCTGYLNKFNTLIQTAMCRAAVQFSTTGDALRHYGTRSTESGTALRHYGTHVLQNLVRPALWFSHEVMVMSNTGSLFCRRVARWRLDNMVSVRHYFPLCRCWGFTSAGICRCVSMG